MANALGSSSSWEDAYRSVESLWGLKPDRTLTEYAKIVPEGVVLDLGIGEGRNALFFAKMGYEVEGVDLSQTAIERCLQRAEAQNLKVKAEVEDLKETEITQGKYTLIIAAWVLNFLRKTEVYKIVDKIKDGLKKDGLVYVGAFSPSDPGYQRAKKTLKEVEENTYTLRKESLSFITSHETRLLLSSTALGSFTSSKAQD